MSYKAKTGLELAEASLDDFVGYVLTYSVNSSDYSGKRREALLDVIWGTVPQSDEFEDQAGSLLDQLDALESDLRRGIE